MTGVGIGFVIGALALAAFYGWVRRLPVPPVTEEDEEDNRAMSAQGRA